MCLQPNHRMLELSEGIERVESVTIGALELSKGTEQVESVTIEAALALT